MMKEIGNLNGKNLRIQEFFRGQKKQIPRARYRSATCGRIAFSKRLIRDERLSRGYAINALFNMKARGTKGHNTGV